MESDGKYYHSGAPQLGAGALRLLASLVEVWNQVVQPQKKEYTGPKADERRQTAP